MARPFSGHHARAMVKSAAQPLSDPRGPLQRRHRDGGQSHRHRHGEGPTTNFAALFPS